MSRISTKTVQEQQAIREAKRQWHKAYHSNPERKALDRAYQKEYRTRPGEKEYRRKAQAKYAKSKKGIATRIRYWQRPATIARGSYNNDGITISLDPSPNYLFQLLNIP
ncbi:protein of unknown function [Nitrosotalea devaniterrae]|uniref:Uncharacterized protein n=1 Tax=Nitrosotalea devaniterrae TaxID=1078905 RepID=A0A128A1U4_9ARCH|nr:protein of unknown function [Candidatus Nitrosotalea devanaterra]